MATPYPRPLETTTLTGYGKVQVTKLARKVLEKKYGPMPPGTTLQWFEMEDGDLLFKVIRKPDEE